nr:uncharacterized protein LOC109622773 [Aedes albopictus]
MIIIYFLAILLLAESKMEIRNLHTDPVLLMKLGNCGIQTGTTIIVHPINLTNIEENIHNFHMITKNLDPKIPISELVIRRSRNLLDTFYQIKPLRSRRVRRYDAIGTAFKWIAGTPDADDLKLINGTLNELINNNNQQIQINTKINERIQDITRTVNEIIQKNDVINQILLQEIDALNLLAYMDTTFNILRDIEDTILKSRLSLANSKLLSLKEIFAIESIINEQGITTQFPEEALDFVESKIAVKQEMLLYILRIPKLDTKAEVFQITPLLVNNTIITGIPSHIIKSGQDIFSTEKPNDFIQRYPFIKTMEQGCVKSLFFGKQSHCNILVQYNGFTHMISEDKILISEVEPTTLTSNCGPDNRTLDGNFLISFSNCSIWIKNTTFTNSELTVNTPEIFGAFPGLQINRSVLQQHNLSFITSQMFENRRKIEHIQFKQYRNNTWIFSIFGGISSTLATFIIIAILCLRRKKIVIKIKQSSPKRKPKTSHTAELINQQSSSIEAGNPGNNQHQ